MYMYFQKWNCAQCAASLFPKQNYNVLSPNFYTPIYLWEIYCIYFQNQSVCYAAAKYECGNWDWGRTIPRKVIHKWDFRCSAESAYSLLLWALAFLFKPVNLVKTLCTVFELKFVQLWMDSCDVGWISVTWYGFLWLGMDSCDLGWIPVTWDWILWLGMDSCDLVWIPGLVWIPVTWYGFLWVGMGPWHPYICPWPSYKPYDDFLCEMVCALKGTIAWDAFSLFASYLG